MNITEMVEKSYNSAAEMLGFVVQHNQKYEEEQHLACAHFGLDYIPTKLFLSDEEFLEIQAQNLLSILLKREEANRKAEWSELKMYE